MNEVGEFPFVCENCLGPDPYVRMIKSKQGAECKLTSRPFTSFKWRVRGSANGAWRQTQVCIEIAKLKNCCQVCLRDMTYLVPMNVRDSVLKDNPYNVQLPSSFAGQQYFLQRKAHEQEQYAQTTAKRLKVSQNNEQRVQTSMGHGSILAKRLDDNVYIVELEWKLAGNQKARIYTKTLH
eukprot:g5300.t1